MTYSRAMLGGLFLWGMVACMTKASQEPPAVEPPRIHVASDSLVLIPEKGLVFLAGQPFSGYAVSSYPNGVQAASIGYWKGKKHGTYRKWFESGLLSFESHYVDGKQQGYTRTWWKNGQLRSESNFKYGKPDGVQQQWYKSGALFKRRQLVAGREHGLQQSWRENGKLYNNYEAKNGRIFGLKRSTLCYQLDDESITYGE